MTTGSNAAPEDEASCFSQAIFGWVRPFLRQAYHESLTGSFSLDSLPAIPSREDPCLNVARLWTLVEEEMQRKNPSMHRACWRLWRPIVIPQFVLGMVIAAIFAASPLLLRLIIRAMRGDLPLAVGYIAVGSLATTGMVGGLLQQQAFHRMSHLGRMTWLCFVGCIFEKSARLDTSVFSQKFSEGHLISLIGQDASMFPYLSPFISIFMSCPFNIIFPSIVLLVLLKEAFAAALAACMLVMLVSDRASAMYKVFVSAKMKLADQRLVLINESFQGVRSVKLCVWEASIEARVRSVRNQELRKLLWAHLCYALQQGLVASLPVFLALVTFVIHAALGRKFEADTVFMALACFDQLAIGFLILPNCQLQYKTFSTTVSRVGRFLLHSDTYTAMSTDGTPVGVFMSNCCFRWAGATAKPTLSDITLNVREGELVAVVGRVASGKSSLAAAALGLLSRTSGTLVVRGDCAFVPQSPQILNTTVQQNVTFGLPFNKERYSQALRACCLESDIAQFADGDLTEIGEKGITISGGQKARIALARALYSDARVVILDDVLSAMDAHVGSVVFQKCIQESMQLQGKAVLFLTNQVHFCQSADDIYVLDAGRIIQNGTFKALSHHDGVFTELYSSISSAEPEDAVGPGDAKSSPGEPLQNHTESVHHAAQGPKKRRVSGMTQEVLLQGRIGIREFLRVARAGHSLTLGVLFVLLCFLAPALMFASSISLSAWATTAAHNDPMDHKTEFLIYLATGGLFAICQMGRVCVAAKYFVQVSKHLHERMLAATLRQTMLWYDTTPLGRILNRFSQDVSLVDLQLPRIFEFMMQHLGVVMIGVIGATALAWPTIIVVLPLLFFVRAIFNQYGTVSIHLQRIMLVSTSPVMSQMSSFLTSLDTIRAFRRENYFIGEFRKSMANYNQAYYWIHALDRFVMSTLVSICVPVLTLVLGCGILLLSKTRLISADLAALALALESSLSLRIPLWLWCTATTEKFFGGAQRISEFSELAWEGSTLDHAAWRSNSFQLTTQSKSEQSSVPALELQNIRLRYQVDLPLVLQGLSLRLERGQKLGVCGRTGSGKSTLFLASFRMLEPESGRIFVNGQDASAMPLPTLRARLGIVPQDPLMFSGTIRTNLDFHGIHTESETWEALRLVQLDSQVRSLEGGLDAPVQEKGSNFSMGTVQLLCIARVLLGRQEIVFLDECTASVDYETDAAVQEAVRSALAGCSIVCIAHRIHTIIDYDAVAFLHAGVVAEHGTPFDLLQNPDGYFTRLVESTGVANAQDLRQRAKIRWI